jgi:DNA mismatch endonuclease (patch repair protein)
VFNLFGALHYDKRMVDKYDKATRSRMMAAVRSRGNRSTEVRLAKLLRKHRLSGWRRQYPIPGTPDFCWPKGRVAVFVDGCFWHGCPRCRRAPKSNQTFWDAKVAENKRRDRKVTTILRKKGWVVLRIWERQIEKEATIRRIVAGVSGAGTVSFCQSFSGRKGS